MRRGRSRLNDRALKIPVQVQPSRRGFTLVELVVYSAIVAIMAISMLRAFTQSEKAKIASAAETARRINNIACTINATTGDWPADVKNSTLPPKMQPYLSNNIFANDTPLNGRWDWNGPTTNVGNLIKIPLRFSPAATANNQLLSKLDKLHDDGDLLTGSCQRILYSGNLWYVISVATK
ncbi:MAG: prepilin-type N-terminal cleavage/methylation domain-containing protein [Planctomycetes bacterium]|nr:prepilin-type N-terminal cleavage/methylation domain-containing protein [Planctomycetota bacterium]